MLCHWGRMLTYSFSCDWTDTSVSQGARHHGHAGSVHLHRAGLEVEVKNILDIQTSTWATENTSLVEHICLYIDYIDTA